MYPLSRFPFRKLSNSIFSASVRLYVLRILGQMYLLVQFCGLRIRVQGIMLCFSQRRHPRIHGIPLVFDLLRVQLVSLSLFQPGGLLHWLIWH